MRLGFKDFSLSTAWIHTKALHSQVYLEAEVSIDPTIGFTYMRADGMKDHVAELLLAAIPVITIAVSIYYLVRHLFDALSFRHLWWNNQLPLSDRLFLCLQEYLFFLAIPIAALGMELSNIYGIFRPEDGKKLCLNFYDLALGNYEDHNILFHRFDPNFTDRAIAGCQNIAGGNPPRPEVPVSGRQEYFKEHPVLEEESKKMATHYIAAIDRIVLEAPYLF